MKRITRGLLAAAVLGAVALTLSACEEKNPTAPPAATAAPNAPAPAGVTNPAGTEMPAMPPPPSGTR